MQSDLRVAGPEVVLGVRVALVRRLAVPPLPHHKASVFGTMAEDAQRQEAVSPANPITLGSPPYGTTAAAHTCTAGAVWRGALEGCGKAF